jgi:UDP-glucose 4-epimerase
MKALITGVAGFIGSHLADELLNRGWEVVGVDNLSFGREKNVNPSVDFFIDDICKERIVKNLAKGADAIFHMAAIKKVREADSSLPTAVSIGEGTLSVLRAAEANKCKVIIASTSDVYGHGQVPFTESDGQTFGSSDIKRWTYAVSKLYSEHLAYAFQDKIEFVILRYCGAIGERMRNLWSGTHVPLFINAVLHNKPITIHGDGSQTRPLLHVDDVVRCTLLAAENPKANRQAFNVGGNEEISVLNTAKMIHKIANTGNQLILNYIPMKEVFGQYKEIMRREIDTTKTERILGFKQSIPVREALKMIIDKWR